MNTEASLKSYITGFISSALLTLLAYYLVVDRVVSDGAIISLIVILALIQLLVQLVFFLHIDFSVKNRSQLIVLLSMVGIILILVGGTLWIMQHLNYNMTNGAVNNYLNSQDSL